MKKVKPWVTEDEIVFISYLGKHSGRFDRAELLQGYLKGCENRLDWGDIDKTKAIRYADDGLRRVRVAK